MTSEIVLTTLNAKYQHASFGLRYLKANLGELASRCEIYESDINRPAQEIAQKLLELNPRVLGVGIYIWNVQESLRLLSIVRSLRPDIVIVLGGPEISYDTETHPLFSLCDYVVTGEADCSLPLLLHQLLAGDKPSGKIIRSPIPDVTQLKFPYSLYSDKDIANRMIYVEASRGCPFTCEFCLSSLEVPVRQFETDLFLAEMEALFKRGVRTFKFVDRTFNLNLKISKQILLFFLDRVDAGVFGHFEMVPDRLPEGLREIIAKFPPGTLQFEVGIQTFNPTVSTLISRRQDYTKIAENIKWLRANTGVHIHADLIVGLPGESLESFGHGLNQLVALGPQEIQIGILKRLRGTPIVRHDSEWQMVYNPMPPYEVLRTKLISFEEIQLMRKFSSYWDIVVNRGNFSNTVPLLLGDSLYFERFLHFTRWLIKHDVGSSGIALERLSGLIYSYLLETGINEVLVADRIRTDLESRGRPVPPALRGSELTPLSAASVRGRQSKKFIARQINHLTARHCNFSEKR